MKVTSHGCRQIPPQIVDEHAAMEASETPPVKVDEQREESSSSLSMELRSLADEGSNGHSAYLLKPSPRDLHQSFCNQTKISQTRSTRRKRQQIELNQAYQYHVAVEKLLIPCEKEDVCTHVFSRQEKNCD